LVSKRVYKETFTHDVARSIILRGKGTQFAPFVVDAFLKCEEMFRQISSTRQDSAASVDAVLAATGTA
jgi:response regulator RpfG family c-di-GMP phosphodiesterase